MTHDVSPENLHIYLAALVRNYTQLDRKLDRDSGHFISDTLLYKAECCLDKMDALGKKLSRSHPSLTQHTREILDLLLESSQCLEAINRSTAKKAVIRPEPRIVNVSPPLSTLSITSSAQGSIRFANVALHSLQKIASTVDPRAHIHKMSRDFLNTQIHRAFS